MMREEYFVGVDLHKSVIAVCVLDQAGEVVKEEVCRKSSLVSGLRVIDELESLGPRCRIAVEAVGVNRWFVESCQERGLDIVVADPGKLGLKQSGKKTDRRDARELARRLYLGDIERSARSYFPPPEEYATRKVVRTRRKLVQSRQVLVNQVRGMLNAYRIKPPGSSLTTQPALEWLERLDLGIAGLTASVRSLVTVLKSIQEAIAALDHRIREIARELPLTTLVAEAPSIAAQTIVTVSCELGDVARFDSARAAGSQSGLAPRVNNSADAQHHGRIHKKGNAHLRWVLSQWAVRLLARNRAVQQWAVPRLRRMHKNKVRVALARKLLIGLCHCLGTGEIFSLERCLGLAR
jgi:transposase